MSWAAWAFAALYFPGLQVAPLYLFHRQARSQSVYQRMAATAVAACAAGWVPTAQRLAAAATKAGGSSKAALPLTAALGLRTEGLAAACVLPLALTALLFTGPLLALLLSRRSRGSSGGGGGTAPPGRTAASVAAASSLWAQRITCLPLPARLRNWVAAPLLEEFLFRACLISFLLAAGVPPTRCVALSPLLFAACHLHHLYDMLRFQRLSLPVAARQVAFQFAYTHLFGTLASFYFVRTRHLATAVLPHALCNVLGPPSLPPRDSPHRRAVAAGLVGGVLAFCWLVVPLTAPALYGNHM